MIGTRTWVTRSTNKTTNKQTRKKGELQVHQRASKPGNRLSINKMHIFDPILIGAVCLSWLIVNNSRVKARRWFIRSYCVERYEHRIRHNQAGSCTNCGQKRRAGNSFFSFLDEASWQCRCPSRSQYLNISNWIVQSQSVFTLGTKMQALDVWLSAFWKFVAQLKCPWEGLYSLPILVDMWSHHTCLYFQKCQWIESQVRSVHQTQNRPRHRVLWLNQSPQHQHRHQHQLQHQLQHQHQHQLLRMFKSLN